MELLDLPPEIFERVIGHFVTDIGVRKAWKRRMVCKTYAAYIQTEITSNQPAPALRKTNNRTLIGELLPEILERRIVKLNGIPDVLPKLIVKIAGRLAAARNTSTAANRNALLKEVCVVFGAHPDTIFRLAFQPTKEQMASFAQASGDEEALAIAIGMRKHPLISHLISSGISVWSKSLLFGSINEFATRTDIHQFRLPANPDPA